MVAVEIAAGLDDDRLAIRRPVQRNGPAQLARAHTPAPAGQLADRAAIRRDHEQVGCSAVQIADLILAVVKAVHDSRGRRPMGAGRFRRKADRPLRLVGNKHREGDALAVRRPVGVTEPVGRVGHLGCRPVDIDPADENLIPAGFRPFRDKQDPLAVRRPSRRGAARQEPILGPVGVDDPKPGLPPVFKLVGALARVDDPRPVRRDLGVAQPLQVKIVVRRQSSRRRSFLGAHGRRPDGQGGDQNQ